MAEKDIETGTHGYTMQTSSVPEDESSSGYGASIPKLLLVSLPRLALRMIATAQWLAFRPVRQPRLIGILGPLVSMLATPIISVLTDRCTHQWGRRRPFLLGAMLASVISLVLLRLVESSPVISVVLYLCMTIAVNTVEIPLLLLISDLAGDHQVTGAALGEGWATIGSAVTVAYLELLGSYSSVDVFIIMSVAVMVVSVSVVVFFIKETQHEAPEPATGVFSSILTASRSLPRVLTVFAFLSLCVMYGTTTYANNKTEFFETEIEALHSSSESELSSTKVYLVHQACIYVFTWVFPLLTNKIGANSVLSMALASQALLIVTAFIKIKAVVAVIDLAVTVLESTASILLVPVVVHVYGINKDVGACVGVLNAISTCGLLLTNIVGVKIAQTSLGYQLPILVAGVVGLLSLVIVVGILKLRMKVF